MALKYRLKTILTNDDEKEIISAIKEAESKTSGEIRVHIDKKMPKGMEVMDRAVKVFEDIGMTATEQRNGVLIYLALDRRQFAIIGDKGIDEKVPEGFWDDVKEEMAAAFREGKFAKGIIAGIKKAGEKLAEFFPPREADINELPDEISIGGEEADNGG